MWPSEIPKQPHVRGKNGNALKTRHFSDLMLRIFYSKRGIPLGVFLSNTKYVKNAVFYTFRITNKYKIDSFTDSQ